MHGRYCFPSDKRFKKANPYTFLADWGARVHLTLAVDNTGALNPGATLIQPLPMSQSRSLGLGAGISTEANATTDYEFFLSFAEINEQYKHATGPVEGYCPAPSGLLLDSDLHIDELFERALEPVGRKTLRVGHHPGIGSAPPATPKTEIPDYAAYESAFEKLRGKKLGPSKTISEEEFKTIQKLPGNDKFEFLTKNALQEKTDIDHNKQVALLQETKAQSYVNNIVKPVTDILGASFPACVNNLTQLRNEAIIEAALVSADKIEVDGALLVDESNNAIRALNYQLTGTPGKNGTGLEAKVQDVLAQLTACPSRKPPKSPEISYDPI